MVESVSSKRLTSRAVLHDVNPRVIRVMEISDQLRPAEFQDIFRTILGWRFRNIIRIHVGREHDAICLSGRGAAPA